VTGKIVEIIIMEGIALIFFVFAYLIGVKGKMHLIAGYNEKTADRVTDKKGLARLVARLCILIGTASALMPLGTYLFGQTRNGLLLTIGHYGGFILGTVLFMVLQSREYIGRK